MAMLLWMIPLFFVAINLITIFAFWDDKARAIAGEWRISEARLLGLALMGGSPGALFARRFFRHKTRKEPFATLLLLIAVIQLGLGIGCFLF
ncbi:DUF1294 domain-containing protein [Sphingobium cloacae]|uniref:DUF1294 domain-containing protein n=1 Tax=Sphingobium cloacae TaxID=120107 RepID=UPI000B18BD5B|nr:DUF1294 domain-containing protein [Sphingobium cloacae]